MTAETFVDLQALYKRIEKQKKIRAKLLDEFRKLEKNFEIEDIKLAFAEQTRLWQEEENRRRYEIALKAMTVEELESIIAQIEKEVEQREKATGKRIDLGDCQDYLDYKMRLEELKNVT